MRLLLTYLTALHRALSLWCGSLLRRGPVRSCSDRSRLAVLGSSVSEVDHRTWNAATALSAMGLSSRYRRKREVSESFNLLSHNA